MRFFFKKIGVCFLWIQKKNYPLTVASCFTVSVASKWIYIRHLIV